MTESRAPLVVICGGPGGYAAAFLAADMGMAVTLVDSEPNPGGVCLYRGCIPSKALLHAAKVIDDAREAHAFGVEFVQPRIELGRLRAWKNEVVEKLTGGLGDLSKRRKIRYVRGIARFDGPRNLNVSLVTGGVERIGFERAILATGSVPATVPGFPSDSPRVWDSTRALDLPEIPERFLGVCHEGTAGAFQSNFPLPMQ